MAKVKKMAVGGMGSVNPAAIRQYAPVAPMGSMPRGAGNPATAVKPSSLPPTTQAPDYLRNAMANARGIGSLTGSGAPPSQIPPNVRANLGAMSSGLRGLGMKKGGKVSSASSRGDGCAQRGKTKGRMV